MSYDVNDIAVVASRRMNQLDAVTNNLANATTSGFKAEHLHYAMNKKASGAADEVRAFTPILYIDYAQGTINRTGNSLDAAIAGEGFFSVQTKDGIFYTRKGDFTVGKNSQLITQKGDGVVGESGEINITGKSVQIDEQGNIEVDGNNAGKLKIVNFKNPKALVRMGDGLFKDPGSAGMEPIATPRVQSGHLEVSNTNAVKEMIDMIDIQRSFETYQKVIITLTDMDKQSTTRIGRLG